MAAGAPVVLPDGAGAGGVRDAQVPAVPLGRRRGLHRPVHPLWLQAVDSHLRVALQLLSAPSPVSLTITSPQPLLTGFLIS